MLSLAQAEYLAGHVGKSLDACELAGGEGERTERPEIVARSAVIVQGIGDPAVNRRLEGPCRRALSLLGDGAAPDLHARVEGPAAKISSHRVGSRRAGTTAATARHTAQDAARCTGARAWLPLGGVRPILRRLLPPTAWLFRVRVQGFPGL